MRWDYRDGLTEIDRILTESGIEDEFVSRHLWWNSTVDSWSQPHGSEPREGSDDSALRETIVCWKVFADSTCVEANIHFPADWVLLRDAVRRSQKPFRWSVIKGSSIGCRRPASSWSKYIRCVSPWRMPSTARTQNIHASVFCVRWKNDAKPSSFAGDRGFTQRPTPSFWRSSESSTRSARNQSRCLNSDWKKSASKRCKRAASQPKRASRF